MILTLKAAALALVLAAQGTLAQYPMKDCDNGITCAKVSASGLEFDCRFAGTGDKNVLMLHGFPEWSRMYVPLMKELASEGYRSVACNQRGYSPSASPSDKKSYYYDTLRDDVFNIADAVNFTGNFHLVGHDHGAALGFYAATTSQGPKRIITYTSLSIPHLAAFADGLYGPQADLDQQIASQYFTMFVLDDSASIHSGFWYYTLGYTSGFRSKSDFQKALWWYNGAVDAGVMAQPPLMSGGDLLKHGALATAGLRELFGGKPNDGAPATNRVKNTTMPTLFVCGTSDSSILCNKPYALKTSAFCSSRYEYVAVDCGHDLLSCSKSEETAKVVAAVISHIKKGNVKPDFTGKEDDAGRNAGLRKEASASAAAGIIALGIMMYS